MDEQVVRQDKEAEQLEQQFVCVRIVQMNGVDLKQFQFDYDQTWCAFFLNADGTIYGRYGTRAGNRDQSTTHISVPSFKKAMQRALDLHKGYPANKAQLAGKIGPNPEWRAANQIPGLLDKPARATASQHGACIHCHMVTANAKRAKWQQRRLTAADIWVYPLPENIGLKMDVDDGLRVKAVAGDRPAAQAGIMPGDELVMMNGQRLISQADVQWVLHNAPAQTQVAVTLMRSGQTLQKTLALSGNWKESDLTWRASSGPGLRYGLWTKRLSNAEKQQRGIPADGLALIVDNVFGNAAPLQQAGLRKGDIIVAVDGKTGMNESQFLAYIRLNHPPGDKINLTILRGDQRQELEVPTW